MEKDGDVRKLVDIILCKPTTTHEEMVAKCSSIPACILSKEFLNRMFAVLFLRKTLLSGLCRKLFDGNSRLLLSSYKHGGYLGCVITFCLTSDSISIRNVFDRFITFCAIVDILSDEALKKAKVDLLDLNPDIMMVLYQNVLKESFDEHGGLHQFIEYVRHHRCLKWNWNQNVLISTRDPFSSLSTKTDLYINLSNEFLVLFERVPELSKGTESVGELAKSLAGKVLATTSAKLPTIPDEYDLVARLVEARKREKAETDERELLSQLQNLKL